MAIFAQSSVYLKLWLLLVVYLQSIAKALEIQKFKIAFMLTSGIFVF
jgi:hypothetical protein